MTDWSGTLARAFQRHLEQEPFDTGSGGSTGSQAQRAADCRTADTGTSTKVTVVPVVPEPASGTETGDEVAAVGTTGTSGTTQSRSMPVPTEVSQEAFEERAAIVEYDASMPRSWAEGFARLMHGGRPEGIDEAAWRRLIDDGGRFLDRWGIEAHRLGWSALDVFGVRLVERQQGIGSAGLVFLIGGGEVVAIGPDRATVRMHAGTTVTYLRRAAPDAIAIWDLIEPASDAPGQTEGDRP
jgi:hypothetical protein